MLKSQSSCKIVETTRRVVTLDFVHFITVFPFVRKAKIKLKKWEKLLKMNYLVAGLIKCPIKLGIFYLSLI